MINLIYDTIRYVAESGKQQIKLKEKLKTLKLKKSLKSC